MGDYRFLHDTTDDSTGILRTADDAQIPPDPENVDWRTYLEWKAVPNTPDPAQARTLEVEREIARAQVDALTELELRKYLEAREGKVPLVGFALERAYAEAREVEATPGLTDAASYPMLAGLVGVKGATIDDVGAQLRSEWDTIKDSVASVHATKSQAYEDVEAAGTIQAVRDVVENLSF